MAIQYPGGTTVNVSWVQTAGTRRELVDKIVLELGNASWTTKSGGGSGDVILESATTPQGLKMRVRVWDPGSGNCARFTIKNPAETLTSQEFWLLPNAGTKTWRIVANKYQFFMWTEGNTVAREFIAFGVLWIPSFLSVTTICAWIQGNASSDTSTTIESSWRTQMGTGAGTWPRCSMIVDSYLLNIGSSGKAASIRLFGVHPGLEDNNCIIWADDSRFLSDPLVGFGITAETEIAKLRGMLWGAVLLSGTQAGETTYTFDGHNWIAATNNCFNDGTWRPGTLLLATN